MNVLECPVSLPSIPAITWDLCPEPGCEFCICLWGGEGRCYKHSLARVGLDEMDRRYIATDGEFNHKEMGHE